MKMREEEITNRVMAFTGKYDYNSDFSDEDISDEELAKIYKILYRQWKKVCMVGEKYKKEKLVSTIIGLEDEVILLNSKHENMIKFIYMFNNGSNMLDEILEVGKMSRNVKEIGFDYRSISKKSKVPTKKFVPPEKKIEFLMGNHMSQQHVQHMYPQYKGNNNYSWKLHHCGICGHIGTYFYRLYGYPHP